MNRSYSPPKKRLCFRRWHSCLIIPRAFILPSFTSPHPFPLHLRPLLGLSILSLDIPKLSPALRFIYRRQTGSDHLQSNIPPPQPSPEIHRRHRPLVLVALVDVCANPAVQHKGRKPVQRFLRKWLRRTTEMRHFGGVYSGQTDVDLSQLIRHDVLQTTILSRFSPLSPRSLALSILFGP